MTRQTIETLAENLLLELKVEVSQKNVDIVSDHILLICYGELCSAGNVIHEKARTFDILRKRIMAP